MVKSCRYIPEVVNEANVQSSRQNSKERERGIGRDMIIDYFSQIGIDPPKVARLGKIFITGPLIKKKIGTRLKKRLKIKECCFCCFLAQNFHFFFFHQTKNLIPDKFHFGYLNVF